MSFANNPTQKQHNSRYVVFVNYTDTHFKQTTLNALFHGKFEYAEEMNWPLCKQRFYREQRQVNNAKISEIQAIDKKDSASAFQNFPKKKKLSLNYTP